MFKLYFLITEIINTVVPFNTFNYWLNKCGKSNVCFRDRQQHFPIIEIMAQFRNSAKDCTADNYKRNLSKLQSINHTMNYTRMIEKDICFTILLKLVM